LRLKTFGGLWIENSGVDSDAGPRPRPLALVAILAVAGANGVSRDRVLSVLWPDADEDRARQRLSQTIYTLRRDLGVDVVLTTPTLRLDASVISTDVADFRAAVAAKNWTEAEALYAGPFLDGFYLAEAPEFERWAESERSSLATDAIRAIETLAKASVGAGRYEEAAEHWRRLTRLDPVNSRIAASYMETLAALGDRAGALTHGRAHMELLRSEFDAKPDRQLEALMTRLRESGGAPFDAPARPSISPPLATAGVATPAPPAKSEPSAAVTVEELPATARITPTVSWRLDTTVRRRATFSVVAILGLSIAAIVVWRTATASRRGIRQGSVLAVGRIRDLAAPDSAALSGVLSEMLATSLGRVSALQVIANSRMLELAPRDANAPPTALTDAARRAGATEIIEGELMPLADRQLRLEVRRVDIGRGVVLGGYRVSGTDRIALFDSVTALIAADFRVGAPTGSLAEVSTRSPVAYGFYEEGLRALYQYDAFAANRLFQLAVREDSNFAMAVYYAWRAARTIEDPMWMKLSDRALSLASRAPPHDRLLIMAHVGAAISDPRAGAAAETLAANYPRDPEALARAADLTADLSRAVALLNKSIALDSAAGISSAAQCRLCEAFGSLALRYEWADSDAAVRRTFERWRTLRPNDALPWGMIADWQTGFGRRAEADAAARRYEALGGSPGNLHLGELVKSLRYDDFEAANRACEDNLAASDSVQFGRYRWFCLIALREQGRYREAVALVRDGRLPKSRIVRRVPPFDDYQAAIIDMEMGRGLAAADEFLAARRVLADTAPQAEGTLARSTTWVMTLSATAAVAGGDTLPARRLVDSIEAFGRRSSYPRDPLLHHFVRGLLYSRAHHDDAAVQEYRAALQSPTFGYTRINYELGQSLLRLNRPTEAIPTVQAALHGGIEGSNLYITRTELHELLAQLFDATQQRDSAAAHYLVVERAWLSADPFLKRRYDAARQWLIRAGRSPRG
jgi:DNA-binding SARP family transcriptional activator/TolB-like protein